MRHTPHLPKSIAMLADAKLQRVLMLVLVALLAAIGVILVSSRGSGGGFTATARSAFDGPPMPANLPAANFSLVDQHGRRITLSHERGKVVVLTFIHSLCHDTCPFMVEQIKGANRNRFLTKHEMDGRMAFVNGPARAMRRIWHAYAIQPVTPKVDHSTFVMLIDKRGYERVGFPADQLTPEGLAHDIRVLEREPA
jgi:protein SCO1/2